ncbi:kinesin-like protein [Pycnococcus provasolii]
MEASCESLWVSVRLRPPPSSAELDGESSQYLSPDVNYDSEKLAWLATADHRVLPAHEPQPHEVSSLLSPQDKHDFAFECVFPPSSSNDDVYRVRAKHVAESVVLGFNGTVFAYGQTSSGKTHTMTGNAQDPGIIPRAVRDVFDKSHQLADESLREVLVRVSYFEIYDEELRDLLDPTAKHKLNIREEAERGVYVAGLREHIVNDADAALALMDRGSKFRATGETANNKQSSRSHSIFRMVVESQIRASSAKSGNARGGTRFGVLTLVDLAGSERVRKAQTSGDRLKEGASINKSLLTLGTVINKLAEGTPATHIPFRDSRLTRILAPSLGGNAKTTVICNVAPATRHFAETLSTLRFAARAKKVKNFARVNETVSTGKVLLQQKTSEIARIRWRLATSAATVAARSQVEREVTRMRQDILDSRRKQDILMAQKPYNHHTQQEDDVPASPVSPSFTNTMVARLRESAKHARAKSRWRVALTAVQSERHKDAAARLAEVASQAVKQERIARNQAEKKDEALRRAAAELDSARSAWAQREVEAAAASAAEAQRIRDAVSLREAAEKLAEDISGKMRRTEGKLAEEERERAKLATKFAEVEAERTALAKKLQATMEAYEELERSARNKIESAESAAAEASSRCGDLNAELHDTNARAKVLESSHGDEARKAADALSRESGLRAKAESRAKNAESEWERAETELEELGKRLAEMEGRAMRSADTIEANKADMEHMRNTAMAEITSVRREAEMAMANATASTEQWKSRCESAEEEVQRLQAQLLEAQREQSNLAEGLANAHSGLQNTTSSMEQWKSRCESAEEESQRLQAQLLEAQREQSNLAEGLANAHSGLQNTTSSMEQWKSRCESAEEEVQRLQAQLLEAQHEQSNLAEGLEDARVGLQSGLQMAKDELAKLQRAAAAAAEEGERERATLRAALACAGSDAEARTEELAAANSATTAAEEALASARRQAEGDAIELSASRVRAESAEARAKSALDALRDRERELADARSQSARAAAAANAPLARVGELEAALALTKEEINAARAGEAAAIERASKAEGMAATEIATRARLALHLEEENVKRRIAVEEERSARIAGAFAAEEEKARLRVRLSAAEATATAAADEALGLHERLHKVADAVGAAGGSSNMTWLQNRLNSEPQPPLPAPTVAPLVPAPFESPRAAAAPFESPRAAAAPLTTVGSSGFEQVPSPGFMTALPAAVGRSSPDWALIAARATPTAPSEPQDMTSVLSEARQLQEHLDAIYRLADGARCPADVMTAVAKGGLSTTTP